MSGLVQEPLWAELDPEDVECPEFPGAECRWPPSCASDGCWRRECADTGKDLYGIGPNVRSSA